jgi:hypothetical protein
MPNPTIAEAVNSRAHPVCDALQQRVHQLSFLIFPVFCLIKGGELHPARNPWIGAGIDQECGDRQRTLVGDVAKQLGVAKPKNGGSASRNPPLIAGRPEGRPLRAYGVRTRTSDAVARPALSL